MNDEERLIKLRDCFTGGYTLPQFCFDENIKKPLIVTEGKFLNFMWEIYVQFRYDKKMSAQFSTLDLPSGKVNFSVYAILSSMTYKNFSDINLDEFDKIIFLTTAKKDFKDSRAIHLDALLNYFARKTYVEIPLLKFLQRYPQVKLILTRYPYIARQKGYLEFYKQIKGLEEMRRILRKDKSGNVKTTLDKFGYNNSEVLELMEAPKVTTNLDGSTTQGDNEHPLMKIKNGKRETAYQPENFLNKIYFVGSCHDFGVNAPFDKTIASYLQKMLNENNLPYCVENESQRYFSRYQDFFYNLNELSPSPGDIIFIWVSNVVAKNLPFLDLIDAFDPPHDFKEIFCVKGHVNELGYKILAERYFKFLTENNFFRDKEFNYPPPPPISPLRHTATIRGGRRKIFCQRGLGGLQKAA